MDRRRVRSAWLVVATAAGLALAACGTTGTAATKGSSHRVTVSISLQRHRVTSGSSIRGVVTLMNHTSEAIRVEACARDGWLDVAISPPVIGPQTAPMVVGCRSIVRLSPGPNRFAIRLSTTYQRCTPRGAGAATTGEPVCGPAGAPALPAGRYATRVVLLGLPAGTSEPRPTTVTLLPPVGVAYSDEVFAAAPLPPGARPTTVAVPTLRAPGQSLPQQVDVHRLYVVPGTRASVAAFLLHHLPPGASANQGTLIQTDPDPYDAEFMGLTMPAAGPNEDQATLLYAFAADGTGSEELRIDAETVSVPSRAPSEKASPTGPVVVTGYGSTSLGQGSSSPAQVSLTGVRAAQLRWIFDRLGLGVSAQCMEYESLYKIRIFEGGTRTLSASGDFCAGDTVEVATGPRSGTTLSDPHCLLLAEVVRVLPARAGSATRGALRECRAIYVG